MPKHPGASVPMPPVSSGGSGPHQMSPEELLFGVLPERLPPTDDDYETYADRQAYNDHGRHGGNYLAAQAIEKARREYNAAEQRRIEAQTTEERVEHRQRIADLERQADSVVEGLGELLAVARAREVTVAEALTRLSALQAKAAELRRLRDERAKAVQTTEFIRAHPHRYLDAFYRRYGTFLTREPFTWTVQSRPRAS